MTFAFPETAPVFTVTLHDGPPLPETAVTQAAARYARILSRQLGSPSDVAQCLECLERWQDADSEEIPPEAPELLKRWTRAVRAATEAACQGLALEENSYFEVRRALH